MSAVSRIRTDGREQAVSSAPVIFEENLYGKSIQVEHSGALDPDRELFSVIAHVLASEIRKKKLQEYLLRLSYQDQLTVFKTTPLTSAC